MTEKEAKDYVVNECKATRCKYLRGNNECVEDGECFKVKQIVIKTLKKQIPKKPIWGTSDYINRHHCATCDGIVGVKQPYCDNCGQKLDWGNEDAV